MFGILVNKWSVRTKYLCRNQVVCRNLDIHGLSEPRHDVIKAIEGTTRGCADRITVCANRFLTDRPAADNMLVGVVRVQAVNYPKKYSIRFPRIL